jgi:hypothetical protein
MVPVCVDDWDDVTPLHNQKYSGINRNKDNLHKKYNFLQKKRVPTGDPNIPTEVLKDKQIKEAILEKLESIYIGSSNNIELDIDPDCEYEDTSTTNLTLDSKTLPQLQKA